MFICTKLIKETGRPPGLIFGLARTSSSFGKNHTFDEVIVGVHLGGSPNIGGAPPSLLGFGIRFGGAPPFWVVPPPFYQFVGTYLEGSPILEGAPLFF